MPNSSAPPLFPDEVPQELQIKKQTGGVTDSALTYPSVSVPQKDIDAPSENHVDNHTAAPSHIESSSKESLKQNSSVASEQCSSNNRNVNIELAQNAISYTANDVVIHLNADDHLGHSNSPAAAGHLPTETKKHVLDIGVVTTTAGSTSEDEAQSVKPLHDADRSDQESFQRTGGKNESAGRKDGTENLAIEGVLNGDEKGTGVNVAEPGDRKDDDNQTEGNSVQNLYTQPHEPLDGKKYSVAIPPNDVYCNDPLFAPDDTSSIAKPLGVTGRHDANETLEPRSTRKKPFLSIQKLCLMQNKSPNPLRKPTRSPSNAVSLGARHQQAAWLAKKKAEQASAKTQLKLSRSKAHTPSKVRVILLATQVSSPEKASLLREVIAATSNRSLLNDYLIDLLEYVSVYPFAERLCFFALRHLFSCHPQFVLTLPRPALVAELFRFQTTDGAAADFMLLILTYEAHFCSLEVRRQGPWNTYLLLEVCRNRANVLNYAELPWSSLRDWICRIWVELPSSHLPTIAELSIAWINNPHTPFEKKTTAFAVLGAYVSAYKERALEHLLTVFFAVIIDTHGRCTRELQHVLMVIPRDKLFRITRRCLCEQGVITNVTLWTSLVLYTWGPESPPALLSSSLPAGITYGKLPTPLFDLLSCCMCVFLEEAGIRSMEYCKREHQTTARSADLSLFAQEGHMHDKEIIAVHAVTCASPSGPVPHGTLVRTSADDIAGSNHRGTKKILYSKALFDSLANQALADGRNKTEAEFHVSKNLKLEKYSRTNTSSTAASDSECNEMSSLRRRGTSQTTVVACKAAVGHTAIDGATALIDSRSPEAWLALADTALKIACLKLTNPISARDALQLLVHLLLTGPFPLIQRPICSTLVRPLVPFLARQRFIWTSSSCVSTKIVGFLSQLLRLVTLVATSCPQFQLNEKSVRREFITVERAAVPLRYSDIAMMNVLAQVSPSIHSKRETCQSSSQYHHCWTCSKAVSKACQAQLDSNSPVAVSPLKITGLHHFALKNPFSPLAPKEKLLQDLPKFPAIAPAEKSKPVSPPPIQASIDPMMLDAAVETALRNALARLDFFDVSDGRLHIKRDQMSAIGLSSVPVTTKIKSPSKLDKKLGPWPCNQPENQATVSHRPTEENSSFPGRENGVPQAFHSTFEGAAQFKEFLTTRSRDSFESPEHRDAEQFRVDNPLSQGAAKALSTGHSQKAGKKERKSPHAVTATDVSGCEEKFKQQEIPAAGMAAEKAALKEDFSATPNELAAVQPKHRMSNLQTQIHGKLSRLRVIHQSGTFSAVSVKHATPGPFPSSPLGIDGDLHKKTLRGSPQFGFTAPPTLTQFYQRDTLSTRDLFGADDSGGVSAPVACLSEPSLSLVPPYSSCSTFPPIQSFVLPPSAGTARQIPSNVPAPLTGWSAQMLTPLPVAFDMSSINAYRKGPFDTLSVLPLRPTSVPPASKAVELAPSNYADDSRCPMLTNGVMAPQSVNPDMLTFRGIRPYVRVPPTFLELPCEASRVATLKPNYRRPIGLHNLGASYLRWSCFKFLCSIVACYLNSVLQALFCTDAFVANIFRVPPPKETGRCDDYSNAQLHREIQILFGRMLLRRRGAITPRSVFNTLPEIYLQGQQDASELARYVFSALGGNQEALIKAIFGGQIVTKVRCTRCNNVSSREEIISDFGFPVPTEREAGINSEISVQSMVDTYAQKEILSGSNAYVCEPCGEKVTAERWSEIQSPPAHVFVVLNRFSWDDKTMQRRKEKTFALANRELQMWGLGYSLYAAVFHQGATATSGHYYTLACHAEDPECRWYRFNDSVVTPEDSHVVNSIARDPAKDDCPYLLFYRCTLAPACPQFLIPEDLMKAIKHAERSDKRNF